VSQDKFSVLKIMPRYNFGEFMDFLPKGFNPFKIQSVLQLEFLPFFLFKIQGELEVGPKRMFACFEFIHQLAKFGNFWS
jgi:hypothetical protein